MIPDLTFVIATFNRFNTQIFGGTLPVPRFCLTYARTFHGKLVYKWRRHLLKKECYDFEMRISRDFDLPLDSPPKRIYNILNFRFTDIS